MWEGLAAKGLREIFGGVMEILYNLIVAVVTWLCISQNSQDSILKKINFVVYKLHFNKT